MAVARARQAAMSNELVMFGDHCTVAVRVVRADSQANAATGAKGIGRPQRKTK